MEDRIKDLSMQLSEIQQGKPWIGSNFKKKIEAVGEEDFFRRPNRQMHSIAEIISHLTAWRKETLVKMETGKGSLKDDDPRNWRSLDELRLMGRATLLEDYDKSLSEILDVLKDKEDDFLENTYYDPDFQGIFNYGWLLNGMLQHDVYHLGQIGYIVKSLKTQ